MISSVQLYGTEALIAAIKRALLSHKPAEVRKALRRGAMILVRAAKNNIHHSISGTLKNSIKILPVFNKDPASLFVAPKIASKYRKKNQRINGTGLSTASPFYAHWVEYGTAEHSLGFKGKFVEVTGKLHPGSQPKPYMEDLSKLIESKVYAR